jgi:hypothetical protein
MGRFLLFLILITGCASQERTKYAAFNEKVGGYRERTLDDGLQLVSFKANSHTKKNLVRTFAEFRAIEICHSAQRRLAHLLDSFDLTESKTVTRTSSAGYPAYYYGMSPFWNRYSGFGYGIGWNTQSGSSWNETIHYPEIEVIFECSDQVFDPQLRLREVSAEEMKHLVKDLRGGLQIEKIPSASPNAQKFRTGDILLRADGERLQDLYQLLALFQKEPTRSIRMEVLRDGKLLAGLKLVGVDVTSEKLQLQNEIIQRACKEEEIKKKKLCH